MSLIINHNLLAVSAARNLDRIYDRLAVSTTRLSSGLRINSAADDPAGLAVREMMRADIAALQQGERNASDAVSMLQVAQGALTIIDEKLIRMKELAEQASTGTYTTAQREVMNSEYQEMAAEIDRIASATDFNGIQLLDGSLAHLSRGSGLKIHFGTGNDPDEDYYFISIDDMRATEISGLKIGGDATNDIWGQGGAGGCCGIGGLDSLTASIAGIENKTFSYAYNYQADGDFDPNGTGSGGLATHFSYLAGVYQAESGWSLQDLVNEVNQGTQSRIKVDFSGNVSASTWGLGSSASGAVNICLGDEVYQFISATTPSAYDSSKDVFKVLDLHITAASALTQAINQCSLSFWAMSKDGDVYVYHKEGGDNDHLTGCDEGLGSAGTSAASAYVNWQNMEAYTTHSSGTNFGLGGEDWATMTAFETAPGNWSTTLEGRDVGDRHDLQIADFGSGAADLDITGMGWDAGSETFDGFGPSDFTELQDAADAPWVGAEIRTQSTAQLSLDAVDRAIEMKTSMESVLGAMQNRLENTVTQLGLQSDALQTAEAKISDVDYARETTEYTKNLVLAEAATAILAQANSLPELALTLLET